MNVRYLRSVVSVALSCWFGFLACMLGCAQPSLAVAHCEQSQASGVNAASANSKRQTAEPCCNHGRNQSDGTHNKTHGGASCCPLDATLIQKQDSVSQASAGTNLAVLAPLTLDFPSSFPPIDGELSEAGPAYAGRDVLLRTHLLRI